FVTSSARLSDVPAFPTRRSSDLIAQFASLHAFRGRNPVGVELFQPARYGQVAVEFTACVLITIGEVVLLDLRQHLLQRPVFGIVDRKSTRLNSSHVKISYAVFCL